VGDKDGNTPLHMALDEEVDGALVSLLVAKGADVNIKNTDG